MFQILFLCYYIHRSATYHVIVHAEATFTWIVDPLICRNNVWLPPVGELVVFIAAWDVLPEHAICVIVAYDELVKPSKKHDNIPFVTPDAPFTVIKPRVPVE